MLGEDRVLLEGCDGEVPALMRQSRQWHERLVAEREDATVVVGERHLGRGRGRVRRVALMPDRPRGFIGESVYDDPEWDILTPEKKARSPTPLTGSALLPSAAGNESNCARVTTSPARTLMVPVFGL